MIPMIRRHWLFGLIAQIATVAAVWFGESFTPQYDWRPSGVCECGGTYVPWQAIEVAP